MAGSRSLGVLTLDLVAKVGGFEQGMDRAARTADSRMKEISRKVKVASAAIGAALVAGAGLAANAIRNTIDNMDEMSKAAQRAQLPTDQFSRLAYAGSLADVEMQAITTSMGKLAKAQGDAARGLKTQSDSFDQFGISVSNSDGSLRSTYEVFLDWADAFEKHQGSPEILAAGMNVFGRSFQNLIPLLKDGRSGLEDAANEADRLGVTLDTKTGQQAEAFNDNLTRLRTAVSGLWQSLARELLPDLVRLTDEFVDTATGGDGLAESIRGIGRSFRETFRDVFDFHDRLVILRSEMAALELQAQRYSPTAGLRSLIDGGTFEAPYEDIVRRQEELGNRAEAARARIEGRNSPFARVLGSVDSSYNARQSVATPTITPPSSGGKKSGGKSDADREAERRIQDLQRLAEAQQQWTDRALDMQAALDGPVSEANRSYEKQISDLNQAFHDGEVELSDYVKLQEVYAKNRDADIKAIEAQRTPFQQMLEDLAFEHELLGMTNEQREIAIAQRWANVDALSEEGKQLADAVRQTREGAKQMGDVIEAQDAVRDAGADFLTDWTTGAKSFKDAALDAFESIHQTILRMISENLMDQLFGERGQNGGGWFGDLMSAFSGGGGGNNRGESSGSLFDLFSDGGFFSWGGGRNTGGPAYAGMMHRINETGIESLRIPGREDYLLMGNKSGTVVPANATGSLTGKQENNFYVQGRMDRRSEDQIMLRLRMQQMQAVRNA